MRRSDIAALAFLALLFTVWFAPGALGGQVINLEDIQGKFFSMRAELYNEAHQYGWSLWNPLQGLGMPRLGIIENGALAPVSLLFYAFPTTTVFAFYPTLVFSLAACFTYGMLRTRSLPCVPSVFGAVAWTTCGAMMVHVQHPPIMETLLWLPATLMCWNLWIATERSAWLAAAAVTFTFQCFGGFPQYILYDALLMAAWFAFDAWDARSERRRVTRVVCGALAVFVVGGLLSAWQMLPAWELARVSQRRFVDPSRFADQFRSTCAELALGLASEAHWIIEPPPLAYSPQNYPNRPNLSALVTVLALLTLIRGGRRPWGAWAAVAFCLLGTLGSAGLVTPLLGAVVPFVKQVRAPSRFIVPAVLLLSWLAARSLERLQLRWPVSCLAVAWVVVAAWSFSHGDLRYASPEAFSPPDGLTRALPRIALDTAQKDPSRLPPYFYLNAGLVAGVGSLVFVETLVPANYFEGMFASQFGPLTQGKNPGKVEILVSAFNIFPLLHPQRPLLRAYGLGTLLHWQNGALRAEPMQRLPHWHVAPAQRVLPAPEQRWDAAYSDDWDPSLYVITDHALEGIPTRLDKPVAASAIEVLAARADEEQVQVDGPGGVLVTSALMYPGWAVRVNGQPAEPIEVDLALRAVVLPPGVHTVEWTYRPPWIPLANACTVVGVLGLLAIVLVSARKRPPEVGSPDAP